MTQEEKLKILKDILLTDEHEYVKTIQKKLETLEEVINEQKKLALHVSPIIEEKLEEFIEEIPKTLGPTITETLKTEITNSKDEVVEALYPIMGKMIKKYIQNEMRLLSERINEKMSKTFSFKRFFKSKITGTKESDLILQELVNPTIEQLMVIEKGSGLLISEYSITQHIEEDVVAAMLTAIKSFVEDAFDKENQNLNYIEYDTYHVHIQNFSSYYIAVIISGTFNVIFKNKLEDNLLNFAQNHINKTDLTNKSAFDKKLKAYFKNENI